MSEPRIKIPRRKIAHFCQQYQVKRLALFGSVLREDFNPGSDVDVLVVFEPHARVGFMTLGRMSRELSILLERPVDLVPQEGLKSVIRDSILSDAVEVYAS